MQYSTQTADSISTATGVSSTFMEAYNVMSNMSGMTKITDDAKNTFMYMVNDMTHEPMLLQTPDYVPAANVDNREYDAANTDRFTVDGKTLITKDILQMSHYHVNMAAMLKLGEWFDYLREEGVYDNTRIIIASDHGRTLWQTNDLVMDDGSSLRMDIESYYPTLMVKDFDSTGFNVSDEFMTNADVPILATKGLIESPVNPFTGKPLNDDEKYAHDQYVITSYNWDVGKNNGNTYEASDWACVKDDMRDKSNWTFYYNFVVLKDHKMN